MFRYLLLTCVVVYGASAYNDMLLDVQRHYDANYKASNLDVRVSRLQYKKNAIIKIVRTLIEGVFDLQYGPEYFVDVRDDLIEFGDDTVDSVADYTNEPLNLCLSSSDEAREQFNSLIDITLAELFRIVFNASAPVGNNYFDRILTSYINETEQKPHCRPENVLEDSEDNTNYTVHDGLPFFEDSERNTVACRGVKESRFVGGAVFVFDLLFTKPNTTEMFFGLQLPVDRVTQHNYNLVVYNEHMYMVFGTRPGNVLNIVYASVNGTLDERDEDADYNCRPGVNSVGVVCTTEHVIKNDDFIVVRLSYNYTSGEQMAEYMEPRSSLGRFKSVDDTMFLDRTRQSLRGFVKPVYGGRLFSSTCCDIPNVEVVLTCPFGEDVKCYRPFVTEMSGGCMHEFLSNIQTKYSNITIAEKFNVTAMVLHRGWVN